MDKRNKPRTVNNFSDRLSLLSYFFSETYCGGYSGEDPPLPIPNREVKLTIADGTAPPGGRVGSCHFLIRDPDIIDIGVFCFVHQNVHFVENNSLCQVFGDVFSDANLESSTGVSLPVLR